MRDFLGCNLHSSPSLRGTARSVAVRRTEQGVRWGWRELIASGFERQSRQSLLLSGDEKVLAESREQRYDYPANDASQSGHSIHLLVGCGCGIAARNSEDSKADSELGAAPQRSHRGGARYEGTAGHYAPILTWCQ